MTLDELEALVLELRARVAALEFDAIPVPHRRVVEVHAAKRDPRSEPEPRRVRHSSSQQVIRQHVDVAQHLERIKAHASDALDALAEGSRIAVVAERCAHLSRDMAGRCFNCGWEDT